MSLAVAAIALVPAAVVYGVGVLSKNLSWLQITAVLMGAVGIFTGSPVFILADLIAVYFAYGFAKDAIDFAAHTAAKEGKPHPAVIGPGQLIVKVGTAVLSFLKIPFLLTAFIASGWISFTFFVPLVLDYFQPAASLSQVVITNDVTNTVAVKEAMPLQRIQSMPEQWILEEEPDLDEKPELQDCVGMGTDTEVDRCDEAAL